MAKRVSKKVFKDVTLELAQEASATFAEKTTTLELITAEMNEEINKVKEKYQEEINGLVEALKEPSEILEVFANEQKAKWGKKKSYELLHTVVGFRTGTPKVDKKKGFTWDSVKELLKKYKQFAGFIRSSEEVNKEAILAVTDEDVLAELKDKAFVFVTQDETFYITAKAEKLAAL